MSGHLGDDVAAYVDGQLPPEAVAAADGHLDRCDRCQSAVRYQRLLKDRMRGYEPAVPTTLVHALGALPTTGRRRRRVVRQMFGATAAALGAAAAVLVAAYATGPEPPTADPVAPQPDRLAGIAAAFGSPGEHLGDRQLSELDRAGWTSHRRLGYDHYRLDGRMHDDGRDDQGMVAQMYAGRNDVLVLVEQVGSLAVDALHAFQPHLVADRWLWVREGDPRVLTWDADGMVYSLVTRLSDTSLEHILTDLPAPDPRPSVAQRIGHGLVRMSSLTP